MFPFDEPLPEALVDFHANDHPICKISKSALSINPMAKVQGIVA